MHCLEFFHLSSHYFLDFAVLEDGRLRPLDIVPTVHIRMQSMIRPICTRLA